MEISTNFTIHMQVMTLFENYELTGNLDELELSDEDLD